MFKPGLVSITFRALSTDAVIQAVADAGLSGIEWGGDIHVPHGNIDVAKKVGEATRKAGLEVAAYGSYYRLGVSETQGLHFEAVLDSAKALEAPNIRIWVGTKGSAQTSPEERKFLEAEALRIADLAQRAGILISCEYHGNTLMDTNESALEFLHKTEHPAIRTLWQPLNGSSCETALEGLEKVLPLLTNIHVFHWAPMTERHPLQEGANRWKRYLQMAATTGRDHWTLMEFVPDDLVANFRKDAKVLKTWIQEVAG